MQYLPSLQYPGELRCLAAHLQNQTCDRKTQIKQDWNQKIVTFSEWRFCSLISHLYNPEL